MPIKPSTTPRPQREQAQQRRLRAGILRAGALLGWDARPVAGFAEGVTGRPLSRCGRAEPWRVLEAYATLARRVRAAQAQQPGAVCPKRGTP